MICTGNLDDHCCYFGEVCKHLEENTVPGRRWACGLHRKYGSWEAMYAAPEWSEVIAKAISVGLPETYKCSEWPVEGEKCGVCMNG